MVNIGTLRGVLELDDKFSAQLTAASRNLDATSRKFSQMGSSLNSAGASLLPLSLGISAVGAGSLKMATDLNASLANVSAILTDLSGPQLDKVVGDMKGKIQGLAVDLGKSTNDIAGGMYEVISAFGYTNDTFGQLETSAKAGAAGLATTQEAFNFLTAVTKTYGDTSEEAFKKVADLGFQAVNYGQTTFPALAASIGEVAPIAKLAGVSMEEMFAVIATATGVTGNTAEVTTQMASAMNGLLAPSKTTREMFEDLGVASGEAMIKQYGFVGALQEVAKYSKETGTAILDILGRKEGFILAATLAGEQAGTFTKNLERMGEAARAGGNVVTEAFEKQTQGINKAGFTWAQFLSKMQVASQKFGDALLPILMQATPLMDGVVSAATAAATAFGKLPGPVQAFGVALGVAAIAAPVVLFFLGTAATAWGTLVSIVSAGTAAYVGNTAAVAANNAAVATNAAAVTAASTATKFAAGEQLAFHFGIERARDAMGRFTPTIWQAEQQLLPLSDAIVLSGTSATATTTKVGIFGRAVGLLGGPIGIAVGAIATLAGAWASFKGDWTRSFDVLIPPLGIFRAGLDSVYKALEPHKQLIKDVSSIINSTWILAMDGARKKLTEIGDYIRIGFNNAVSSLKSNIRELSGAMSGTLMSALNVMFPGLDKIIEMYNRAAKKANEWKDAIHSLAGRLKEQADNVGKEGLLPNKMNLTPSALPAGVGQSVAGSYSGSLQAVTSITGMLADMEKAVRALTGAQKEQIIAGDKYGMNAEGIAKALKVMGKEYEVAEEVIEAFLRTQTASAKEMTKSQEAIKALTEQLSGVDALNAASDYMKVLEKIGGVEKLTREEQQQGLQVLEEAIAKYNALGKTAPKAIVDTFIKLQAMNQKLSDSATALDILSGNMQMFAKPVGQGAAALEQFNKELDTFLNKPVLFSKPLDIAKWMEPLKGKPVFDIANPILENLKSVFAEIPNLLQKAFAGGGGWKGALQSIAVEFGQMFANQLTEGLKAAFGKNATGVNKGILSGAVKLGAAGAGLLSGIGAATSGAGTGGQLGMAAMGGLSVGSMAMAQGATLAASASLAGITAGIGAAVVAGVALYKSLAKPLWKKMGAEIGRDFGVEISEELAKQLAKDAKKLGSRQGAAILNLNSITDEGGGLNSGNIDKYTQKFRDLFVMLETGVFNAADAVKVLDANFQEFAEAGTDANGRISDGLREIIILTRKFGLESKQVTEYLKGQAQVALEGFNATVLGASSVTNKYQEWADAIKSAKDEIAKLQKEDPTGRDSDTQKRIKELQDKIKESEKLLKDARDSTIASGELTDLGIQAMAVMGAATAAGMPFFEALKQASPGLTALQKAYENLGISIDDAGLRALLVQNQILTGAPQLAAGIDGLTNSFIALSNMGMLNADTFAAMQRTAMQMYTRLQGESAKYGGTQEEVIRNALIPMQKYLHEAQKQAELLGIPLDANTQMLIDQSKELGIWKEEGPTGFQLVTDAIMEMTEELRNFISILTGIPREVGTTVRTDYENGVMPQPTAPPPSGVQKPGDGAGLPPNYDPNSPDWGHTSDSKLRDGVDDINRNLDRLYNNMPSMIGNATRDALRGAAV